ncbi:MAG: septal ring lytic transglycosylase RlpA family protein [Gammaproteobacteria bacterium]|nr:septal ring lytic transglycosylase RlpA family protein [Gammaproteobacteria bacterium]
MHCPCLKFLFIAVVLLILSACGSAPKSTAPTTPTATTRPATTGGYYQDDGPGATKPSNLDSIADAIPKQEKFHSGANRPYTVFGRGYAPVVNNDPFRQTGIASWYGRKFHGNMTSIGETYDMYAMTGAHPTLPLPSYVRVTNPANKKSVVIRLNDRGPFHQDRIIDLSYAAAHRLDIVTRGSAPVLVERVFAGDASAPTPASAATQVSVPQTVITTTPISLEGKQLFIQLGAFSVQENAKIFSARMVRELDWNREPVEVVFKDNLWRVRLGPYQTRIEAEAIQARIKQSHDFSAVISTLKFYSMTLIFRTLFLASIAFFPSRRNRKYRLFKATFHRHQ